MTKRQRDALLALPDTEDAVIRHHSLNTADLAAISAARTPETRLSYALQLCCLRYSGRNLRRGELLPAVMLDDIAEQIGVDADLIAGSPDCVSHQPRSAAARCSRSSTNST